VYRYAYTLVISKQGELLYTGVKSLVRENLDRLAREQIVIQFPSGSATDPLQLAHEGDQLLKAFNAVWADHCSNMTKLKAVLAYMVRYTRRRSSACLTHCRTARIPRLQESFRYTMLASDCS